MLKPSVCIDAVFEDETIETAISKVSKLGFPAIEFWAWWEKDLTQIKSLCAEHDLNIAACCTKFISLTEPELRSQYVEGVSASIEAANELNCTTLISQVGDYSPQLAREQQHNSIVAGLRLVAPLLESANITLVIEPLNDQVDHKGYFLVRSQEAFDIVRQVASPRIKVVYDIYHQQISEGNLISQILNNIDLIGHFHAAGNPGRHELTSGEINYPEIIKAIAGTSYSGYFGLEYWPVEEPSAGLAAIKSWF